MATGYQARQGGRTSFADNGVEAVQTTTGASAESRSARVVGGESIGGVEGDNFTDPGYVAGELGSFFEKFMAPEVERRQQEQFFKGYTEAQSGRALEELTNNGSPLTKMFGPSGFAQGAQFYTGQTAINEWQQEQLRDMDTLKRMSPQELSKHMSDSIQSRLTGDPYADQHIQAGFLEAQAPLIQTHAKARYAWQQDEARQAASSAANSAASSLQEIVRTQAALGEQADTEATNMAAQRFMGTMQKPEGMADETYREFLYDFMRHNMANGNFYGVSILRSQGIDQLFDDDKQRKLEDDYERYGRRALDKAVQGSDILARMLNVDAQIERTKMGATDGATVAWITKEYGDINRILRDRTGVTLDFFDVDKVIAKGGETMSAFTAAYNRQLSRAEQLEDREYARETAFGVAQREAEAQAAAAESALTTGFINAFEAAGGKVTNVDSAAFTDFTQGKYDRIANAFVQSSYVASSVKKQIATLSRAGIGDGYTKATDQAYKLWKQFDAVNPELADAYFGDHSAQFEVFDSIVGTSGPEVAYREAFGTGRTSRGRLYGDQQGEFKAAFDGLIDDTSSGWAPWKWGNYTLNEQGKRDLRRSIYGQVAARAGTSSRSVEDLTRQAYNTAIREGRFEQYGVFGWANSGPTTPVSKVLGLQSKDAHTVVQGAILKALSRVGVEDADGVSVVRTTSGLAILHDDGSGAPVRSFVTNGELRAYANNYVKTKRNRLADPTAGGNWGAVPSL